MAAEALRVDPDQVLIRSFRPDDEAAVADICFRTSGLAEAPADHDRAHAHERAQLAALIQSNYATPYTRLEPDLAIVADASGATGVVGYVIGTADTVRFVERFRSEWLPSVAERLPAPAGQPVTPVERLRWLLHHPEEMIQPWVADYPAHLHIDLLPLAQRRGLGRRLMVAFLARLKAAGVPGVHLGVAGTNLGARAFYHRLGFRQVTAPAEGSAVYLVRSTS